MTMASPDKLLLVGSLPPAVCNGARLTEATATAFLNAGYDVAVLIDELAPPPADNLSLKILRPFDASLQSGDYDAWPRLYVVGNNASSLPTLGMLQAYPGAVLVADNSLYDLALAAFKTVPDGDAAIADWLEGVAGQDGNVLARSITHHRRLSTAIGNEVPGFDACLSAATAHIALSGMQEATLADAGFSPLRVGPPPVNRDAPQSPQPIADTPRRLLAFGIGPTHQTALRHHLSSTDGIDISFSTRHAASVVTEIEAADAILIMDGFDLSFCPLAHASLAAGKIVVCAHQAWVADLPPGCVLPVKHEKAMAELALAIQVLIKNEDLRKALTANHYSDIAADRQAKEWCAAVHETACSAVCMKPPRAVLPPKAPNAPPQAWPASADQPVSGVRALIGAVPAPAILAHQFQDLDRQQCPSFLTPIVTEFLAAFTDEPPLRIPGLFGFEDPLILSTNDNSQQNGNVKVTDWPSIQPALLQAREALTFGCVVDGAQMVTAGQTKHPVQWTFHLPENAFSGRADDTHLDADAGIFCKFDKTRHSLSLVCFTGAAGTLALSIKTSHTVVATNNQATMVLRDGEAQPFKVDGHGIAAIKMAASPSPSGEQVDLTKILAEAGLDLKWSPL